MPCNNKGNAAPEEYQKVCHFMPRVPVSIMRPEVLCQVADVLPEPAGNGPGDDNLSSKAMLSGQ